MKLKNKKKLNKYKKIPPPSFIFPNFPKNVILDEKRKEKKDK